MHTEIRYRKIINSEAAIIRNTQGMRHLNLFIFVEAMFEPPLTVNDGNNNYISYIKEKVAVRLQSNFNLKP